MAYQIKKLGLLVLFLVLAAGSCFAAQKIDGIYYELSWEGTAKVEPCPEGEEKYAGVVTIPASVTVDGNTYSVNAYLPLSV